MFVGLFVLLRYTGTTPAPPPGSHYTSPSENMWNTGGAYSVSQGMAASGTHTQLELLAHEYHLRETNEDKMMCVNTLQQGSRNH